MSEASLTTCFDYLLTHLTITAKLPEELRHRAPGRLHEQDFNYVQPTRTNAIEVQGLLAERRCPAPWVVGLAVAFGTLEEQRGVVPPGSESLVPLFARWSNSLLHPACRQARKIIDLIETHVP